MAKYIDVEALFETAEKQAVEAASLRPDDDTYAKFCNYIADTTYRVGLLTPDADVAPVVHGRWKKGSAPYSDRCSVCGSQYPEAYNDKFCRNCGARMDLGKD